MEDVRRLPVGEDNEAAVTLDELAREGARRMIAAALKAEADRLRRARSPMSATRTASGWSCATAARGSGELTVGSGTVRGPGAARQRQAHRRADRRAPEVQLEDPARVRAALAEGQRRAAGALPARALDRRLPPGAGAAARRGRRRPVAVDDQPAVQGLGGRARSASGPARCAFTATPTCSSTASTSRSGSARTTGSACWS